MPLTKISLPQRVPDIENLYAVLRREVPKRPTLFELFLNDPLYEQILGRPKPQDGGLADLQFTVDAFAAAGYDHATALACPLSFPKGKFQKKDTRSLNEGAIITDEESFEHYPWPDPDQYSYHLLSEIKNYLPGGMKLMVMGPDGILENVISLTGYENLCYLLYEQPSLVKAVFDKVGDILLRYYRNALEFDSVGLIASNDDWGFHSQTLLSPEMMRQYLFPWHRKIVGAAHAHGKPAILHSCGYFADIMEDIIDMGFDARHSYEDNILPVEQAYARWHDRIAILGGIDVDFLVRRPPEEIAKRSRNLVETAGRSGGYALGSGNSIPSYVPPEHYFAMTQIALQST